MEYGIRDLKDLMQLLEKRSFWLGSILAACTLGSLLLSLVLPQKYKSTAILTIYNEYFHTPLIKGIAYEPSDSRELKIQRESLVRSALGSDFLDRLGEKYHLFAHSKDHPYHSGERQELLKRIEILSLNDATYEFSFVAGKPEEAWGVVADILSQVRGTLISERRRSLIGLRDAIRAYLERTSLKQKPTTDPAAADRPDLLVEERSRLESEMASLTKQYTQKHPAVESLAARVKVINSWLESLNRRWPASDGERVTKPLVRGGFAVAEVELYADLSQKLNFLNIALEVENTDQPTYLGLLQEPFVPFKPIWPKKGLFLIWGILTGFLISSFTLFLMEYGSSERPAESAPLVSTRPPEVYVSSQA